LENRKWYEDETMVQNQTQTYIPTYCGA